MRTGQERRCRIKADKRAERTRMPAVCKSVPSTASVAAGKLDCRSWLKELRYSSDKG